MLLLSATARTMPPLLPHCSAASGGWSWRPRRSRGRWWVSPPAARACAPGPGWAAACAARSSSGCRLLPAAAKDALTALRTIATPPPFTPWCAAESAVGTVLGEVHGGKGPGSPLAAAAPGSVLPSADAAEMQARLVGAAAAAGSAGAALPRAAPRICRAARAGGAYPPTCAPACPAALLSCPASFDSAPPRPARPAALPRRQAREVLGAGNLMDPSKPAFGLMPPDATTTPA